MFFLFFLFTYFFSSLLFLFTLEYEYTWVSFNKKATKILTSNDNCSSKNEKDVIVHLKKVVEWMCQNIPVKTKATLRIEINTPNNFWNDNNSSKNDKRCHCTYEEALQGLGWLKNTSSILNKSNTMHNTWKDNDKFQNYRMSLQYRLYTCIMDLLKPCTKATQKMTSTISMTIIYLRITECIFRMDCMSRKAIEWMSQNVALETKSMTRLEINSPNNSCNDNGSSKNYKKCHYTWRRW